MGYGFKIMVEGPYALFSRPEMKVERVSYDVPTPGALEGLLKCVYWKPAIRYVIDQIVVFNPITFINIRRNEVKEKISYSSVKKEMNGTGDATLCTKDCINQRAGMILKNVRYGIAFHFELTGLQCEREEGKEEKHYNILLRRLKNGQCFRQPFLGCREFSVSKLELVEEFPMEQIAPTILEKGNTDLGFMLYRLQFQDGGIPKENDWEKGLYSDTAEPVFYRPHLVNGIIDVAKYKEMNVC